MATVKVQKKNVQYTIDESKLNEYKAKGFALVESKKETKKKEA